MVQSGSIDRRFFARLGATRLVRAICGSTAADGVAAAQGTGLGMDAEDIVHSRLIVLWGTNTIVTNLHLWPFIQEARGQGARVVVIDPLRTRTAQSADWHVRPMPGTDEALALGLMHVIVEEGLLDADYVERHTTGFAELRERVEAYTPERVAAITRVPADEIVELARAYATTRPSAIRVLIGMEHHERGGATYRAIACLPVLDGRLARPRGRAAADDGLGGHGAARRGRAQAARARGPDDPVGEHGADRSGADRPRTADQGARRLQLESRRHRARTRRRCWRVSGAATCSRS